MPLEEPMPATGPRHVEGLDHIVGRESHAAEVEVEGAQRFPMGLLVAIRGALIDDDETEPAIPSRMASPPFYGALTA
jgi:hypothetical protein